MTPQTAPLLERVGTAQLARWSAAVAPDAERAPQAIHLLDDDERAAIRAIERATIARAAIAGACAALLAGVAESFMQGHEHSDPVLFWGVVGFVTAIAAVLEIAFLSWDALRAAHRVALAAGVVLRDDQERAQTFAVLARAALEVANPIETDLGVNPLRETPRWRLAMAALLYKLKVSTTNILLKLLIRRALGRAAVRSWLHFVAVPVTAFWDAFVCARVLRETRVRVFGPSLVQDVVARLLPADREVPPALAETLARAVGAAIVRTADLHPNLERLLRAVLQRLALHEPRALDDVAQFHAGLSQVTSADDRQLVRALLLAAIVIDGRVGRRERALAREVGIDDAVLLAGCVQVRSGVPLVFVPVEGGARARADQGAGV